MAIRVLQSFPHKIGAARICTTAWHQAAGVAAAGGEVTVVTGAVHKPLPTGIEVRTTLARGRVRIPYKVLGSRRAFDRHDRLTARWLRKHAAEIDIVHVWPLAALETLREANRLGIPTVLERPNAHTRFAYEVVARESERLGVALPPGHEHAHNPQRLAREEEEYALADYLLCPSEFVVKTFLDQGFRPHKLLRHSYGYDDTRYVSGEKLQRTRGDGLSALFVGVCAVRKGVHFALDSWLRSPASETGTLTIAGAFLPDYQALLADELAHPSVHALGHRNDVPELMRRSDVLVLPSIEEGSPLVCMEGLGSGLVPLVSDVCAGVNVKSNGLVHPVGDVETLASHFTLLHEDPDRLSRMRAACLEVAPDFTWTRAGERLLAAYEQAIASHQGSGRE